MPKHKCAKRRDRANAAFTCNQVDGGRHLVNDMGQDKQSDRMEGLQNKTHAMTCWYSDAVLLTKNEIKSI